MQDMMLHAMFDIWCMSVGFCTELLYIEHVFFFWQPRELKIFKAHSSQWHITTFTLMCFSVCFLH